MGLISAALGAASGVLADSWKEYFYCEALGSDTLVVKGERESAGSLPTAMATTTSSRRDPASRWRTDSA